MQRFIFIPLIIFMPLLSEELITQPSPQEELTHAQQLWGRKFQASLGYKYFPNTHHHGLEVGYGVWHHNQLGILASVFLPLSYSQNSKVYLISFYGVWDWNPIPWLNIMPKVGYGPKIYQIRDGLEHLSWEPDIGMDITFNLNTFVRIYTSYTWSMFEDQNKSIKQLHGLGLGVRIAY